jgi:microcystin-dependent protein
MASPYTGEIRMFGGNFAPSGWATCDGQTMAISEYETLFQLIGTTYGGDGQTTFNLPNLAGRAVVHQGNNGTSTYVIGQSGGVTNVTLTTGQMTAHSHTVVAEGSAANTTSGSPNNAVYGTTGSTKIYSAAAHSANLHAMAPLLATQGGSQPHDNMQPYLAVTYIISLFGTYPTQS